MISQKNIINILRNDYKINSARMSEIIKSSKEHAEMILNGKIDFTTGEILRLCNHLHIQEDEILSENDN